LMKGGQKVITPTRYHECVAWLRAYLLTQARRSLGQRKAQTTSFVISVHHFSMPAEPVRASRSILATAAQTLSLICSSHFKIVDFEKPCEKSFRRSLWGFGSRMLNMPARLSSIKKAAIFTYESPFGEPSFTLWMMREAAKATSSGADADYRACKGQLIVIALTQNVPTIL
jgi:hypothetical protein